MLVEGLAGADAEDEPALGITAAVAAAWATTAGWMRTVGQVTAVVTGSEQAWEIAPITDQTNGLWPCSSFHGWKWSLIHSASNPAASAAVAWPTSSAGPYSSQDRKYPIFTTGAYPRQVHATPCPGYPDAR